MSTITIPLSKVKATLSEVNANISYDPAQLGYSVINDAPSIDHRHKSGHVYTSAEAYEVEKEKIFRTDWFNIGRVEEVEKPGDYMTFRIADEPIVVVRTKEGEIMAMSNVCAHRGVEIAFGAGNTKLFSCPYHGWVYELDGRLKNAQHLEKTENFDKSNCRLPQLKVETWGGFIFVTLNKNPKPLMEQLGNVEEVYGPYQLDKLRMAMKFPTHLNVNWKLLNENLTDIYHIAVLHASTFGPYQPLEGYRFEVTDGGYHGRFLGGTLTPDGKSLFGGPLPWLPESLHSGGFSSHIPPNIAFFPRFDYVSYTSVWPIEVDQCVGWSYMLFPEEYFAQPDFAEKAKVYADFYQAFLDEDLEMIHSLQKGLKSQAYGRGPMSPFEAGVLSTIKHNIEDVHGE
jgi:phenylpropionate dioxygenase-like ring-hydroxylating dioxygenase large terminal subunit